ncbi:flagellar biosynthesis protein FlhB [Novosphingobium sp. P6W]|uniref:flagellar biosynthesis protein FlhB n=1 Tax=Novosphingobium sp. P6W TaxID=1609758 RepID=UPI0005C2F882|nr:flagellar biosynthesis protein FlhB [Novosphingobium sp. P6W]AXB75334.1 flagellar biosynthesis protein FlhB [Novosphingobium sp. P6W]KIS32622.1 flagellar biosynthesis protein FlhB [Novosphingobium sp. P6W]
MADEADKDQRTHEPTAKKLEDARKRGETAMAPEMRHATMMAGALAVTGWLGLSAMQRLGTMLKRLWGNADDYPLDADGAQNLATGVVWHAALSLLPIFAVLLATAVATVFLQGRATLSWSRVAPKWSKLSPASGAQRLFGTRALVEFAKTLAKISAIGLVVWMVLAPRLEGVDGLVGRAPGAIGAAAAGLAFEALRAVVLLVAALALFDFIYQRRAFLKRMRMTLQEVKDEHKQADGDPKIKAKIRQIQMQRASRRMMSAVSGASVIVTNPTHYAVALKYEHGVTAAPTVVAKGVDAVALRIREVGAEANVPIFESPPLARALFAAVEIDHPIPIEHYAAVAEIIGYVMRIAREKGQ